MKGIELLVAGRSVKTVAARGRLSAAKRLRLTFPADFWNDTENIGYRARGPRKANEAEIVGDVQCPGYAELPTGEMIDPES